MPVVNELRRLGHDVLTIAEAGLSNQQTPDIEVLRFASADNRVVLTLNRKHFVQLHNMSADHGGIVVCMVDLDAIAQAQRKHETVISGEPLKRALVRINRPA